MKNMTRIFLAFLCVAALCFVSCVFSPDDDSNNTNQNQNQNPNNNGNNNNGNGGNKNQTTSAISEEFKAAKKYADSAGKKRGFCYNNLTQEQANAISAGKNSWGYNWAETPAESYIGGNSKIAFCPMMWGGTGGETELRKYLEANKGKVKYLLGFNEPNLTGVSGGSNIPPARAAAMWPTLEKIAEDYDLELVSPAMNYSGEILSDGKLYNTPESWLDEFIREYKKLNDGKEPRMDYIALHCYMMWPGATVDFFCNTYAKMYNRQVWLTEFCSWWDNEGINCTEEVQIQKMSQKVEGMEQNENVAYYAWFMADGAYNERPWNSFFAGKKEAKVPTLSKLGLIYQHLSTCDKTKYYSADEKIAAVDYVSSSNYRSSASDPWNIFLYFAENDDSESKNAAPVVLEKFASNCFANYQINAAKSADYDFTLRYKSQENVTVKLGGTSKTLPASQSWKEEKITLKLSAGKQTVKLEGGSDKLSVAWLSFAANK